MQGRMRRVAGAAVLGLVAATAALATGLAPPAAADTSYTNATAFTITDCPNPCPASGQQATLYPSTINVAGEANVTDLNVTINGFSHSFPADVDLLLVGPTGQQVTLMSDYGAGSPGVAGINVTFDDEAATAVPAIVTSTPFVTGSYKPVNSGTTDVFPAPAPAESTPPTYGPQPPVLSAFDGTNPNGVWSLYVIDDANLDPGSVSGGWTLTFGNTNVAAARLDPTYTTTGCHSIGVDTGAPNDPGDDSGTMAIGGTGLFYTGDDRTVRTNRDLTGMASVGSHYPAMVSNLATGQVYVLATSAGVPLTDDVGGSVGRLLRIDPATGVLAGDALVVNSSGSLNYTAGNSQRNGVYSGNGIAAFMVNGAVSIYNFATQHLQASGDAAGSGTLPATPSGIQTAEQFLSSGTVEVRADNTIWLNYAASGGGTTVIRRVQVPSGVTEDILTIPGSSDMAQIAFDPTSGGWYFHYESGALFGLPNDFETLGGCGIPAPPAQPAPSARVTVSATTATAVEGGTPGRVTFTRTGSTQQAMRVFYRVAGTATRGQDFADLGTVLIPAGQSSATLDITALSDDVADEGETIEIVVVPGNDYSVGNPNSAATVTISETPVVPQEEACPEPAGSAGEFADVDRGDPDDPTDGDTHAETIACAAELGLVNGTDDGPPRLFDPTGTVSSAQVAALMQRLALAAGAELPEDAPDAYPGEEFPPHDEALDQLAALGIIDPDTFDPTADITRAEIAEIMVAIHELITGEVLEPADDPMEALRAIGVFVGDTEGNLNPDELLSRAQYATVLIRHVNVLLEAGVILDLG